MPANNSGLPSKPTTTSEDRTPQSYQRGHEDVLSIAGDTHHIPPRPAKTGNSRKRRVISRTRKFPWKVTCPKDRSFDRKIESIFLGPKITFGENAKNLVNYVEFSKFGRFR